MANSSIEQLWYGCQSAVNLKIINLNNSLNLSKTPDLTGIPNLESLILEVAGFGLLFWPLLLEVEWRGEGGQLMVAETPLQGWSGGDEEDNEIAVGGLGSGEAGVDGDGGAAVLVLMRRRGDSV
ncbi:hypothetical protein NC652_038348 [Populus alba x Populus x berolinensis]|nr:hypothetical protein NC652_038348 [Populus alba x Populus x berolinensis]